MKNLFDPAVKLEISNRIQALNINSKGQWGKMTVAQMLKHLSIPMNMALTNPKPKRGLMAKIMGPLFKGPVIGPKPFKKNGYTPPELKVDTEEEFNIQKARLTEMLGSFNRANVSDQVHPFFGYLSHDEWGQSQYKHLDHHLAQFGV
jgi:hypothetical protein